MAKVFAAGNKADITDAELLALPAAGPGHLGDLPAAGVDHRRPRVLRRSLPDHAGQAGHRGRGRAHRRRAAGRGVAHRRAGHRRRGPRRGAAPGRAWSGCAPACRCSTPPGPCPASRCRAGRRVAVVTNSGGTGVELTDLLADEGLVVPELSGTPAARTAGHAARLRQRRNPVDMTPAWKPVHHAVPGRDRDAGPVRRGRRGRAGAAAAVGVGGSCGGGPGRGGPAARRTGAGAGLRLLGGAARPRTRTQACCRRRACRASRGRSGRPGRVGVRRPLWHAGREAGHGPAAGHRMPRTGLPPRPAPRLGHALRAEPGSSRMPPGNC